MIRELHIKNFALIDEEAVSFGKGLNVISGETGSGKSTLLHALEIALGAKPSANMIRTGAESLEVSTVIDLAEVHSAIREELPDLAKESEDLSVKRIAQIGGKGRVFINGSLATVSVLTDVMKRLVTICGQRHHVKLLDNDFHLELLDGYAGNEELLLRYRAAFREWQRIESEVLSFEKKEAENARRRVELETIIEELSKPFIAAGVRIALEDEIKRGSNREKITTLVYHLRDALESEEGLLATSSAIKGDIFELKRVDESAEAILGSYLNLEAAIDEFDKVLSVYGSTLDVNKDELEKKRDTLAEIARLERKYKVNDATLIALREDAVKELEALDEVSDIEKLKKLLIEARNSAIALGESLSRKRRESAGRLAKEVMHELSELNMKGSKFEVSFEEGKPHTNGLERCAFLISTVKGEPTKPISDIASGGELSRIMLVLKKILREKSGVNVLVFDEVDSGISGSVARAVGQKLRALASTSQVICITHLPQVASLADHHFLVEKAEGKRASCKIRELKEKEKIEEIARMLAGYTVTDASRESARELLSSKDL